MHACIYAPENQMQLIQIHMHTHNGTSVQPENAPPTLFLWANMALACYQLEMNNNYAVYVCTCYILSAPLDIIIVFLLLGNNVHVPSLV